MFSLGLAVVLAGTGVLLVLDGLREPSWPDDRRFSREETSSRLNREEVRMPEVELAMATGETGPDGQPLVQTCAECHDDRRPNPHARSISSKGFHAGMDYHHGAQSCLTCHDMKNYDKLHTVAGRPLSMSNSLKLCSQCHVFQHRDFVDGVHGGMSGHWDLTRGGRQRQTCIDCHDPHHPATPPVEAEPPPVLVRGETEPEEKTP